MKNKSVIEFLHLCQLYNSDYVKGLFNHPKQGTLADFEKICKVSKNKRFRDWIKGLDILKSTDFSNNYNKYVIIESKLKRIIEKHPLWKIYRNPSYAIYEGILRH